MASTLIRLGTASPSGCPTATETLAQLSRIARAAADLHVDLLLLPEAYIGGYPRGSGFGCVVGSRTQDGRNEYLRYFRGAVDLGDIVGDGAGGGDAWVRRELDGGASRVSGAKGDGLPRRGDGTREELERIARDTGVFLVVGCIEKAGGSLYCAVVYVCPKRGAIGKRRKVMPTGSERLIWAQGSPATLKAVSTEIRGVRINLAAAICWENYMPLVRQALYAQNINLYLAPTADERDAWLSLMRTVGIEGRCFVVSSNMCIRREGVQSSATSNTAKPVEIAGRSQAHPQPSNTDGSSRDFFSEESLRRRNSCLTEEGFEIALPSPTSPRRSTHRRRESVFDEDGNEIVLCCKATSATGAGQNGVGRSHSVGVGGPLPKQRVQANGHSAAPATSKLSANGAGFVSRGGSSIVSPFGDVLAGPQWEDDEGILYADVDFDDCIRGRLDLDAAGSYSRNDSFRFSVQGLDLDPLPY